MSTPYRWRTLAQLEADALEADSRAASHSRRGRREAAKRWREIARVARRLIARRAVTPDREATATLR